MQQLYVYTNRTPSSTEHFLRAYVGGTSTNASIHSHRAKVSTLQAHRNKKKASYNTSLRTIRVYFPSVFFSFLRSFFLFIYFCSFFFFFTHSWTKPGYTHPLPGNSFSCLTQNTFHPHSFLALYSHLLNTRNSERRYDYRCASSCIFSTFLEIFLAAFDEIRSVSSF